VSWVLDMEAHGKTWRGRSGDDRLGTWHLTRQAWEKLLVEEFASPKAALLSFAGPPPHR
jgi:hypothetical protein